ncbi:hypothetical protein V5799_027827 [Amblyomma americanum]|uniref:non-specific serine/threonine protein kinase n=1 Tax=Amblyomma americanum TaxID=6943 RepID=A0AAQ4DEL6_AMBAM
MVQETPPKPDPELFEDSQPLLTKKDSQSRRGLRSRLPRVRAPDRSVWHSSQPQRAQAVSFNGSEHSFSSSHYDERVPVPYLHQCFHVEQILGEGSFGVVYRVRSLDDGRRYAVKVANRRFRGPRDRQHQLQEVAKHEQLPPHPHCVRFVKAWEEDYRLHIQTELCDRSLAAYTECHHDLPEHLVWKFLVDLLLGVKHLHDHNLVHLDIKPENIFISKQGYCKLGDFGLVFDLKLQDDSWDPLDGDPCYLAPELMDGQFTKAADIFSLGITVLELACDLELPGRGRNWHTLRSGSLPDYVVQRLSPDLRRVIELMMNPDPKQRITVNQLLELPEVQSVLRWRRPYVASKRAVAWVEDLYLLGVFWLQSFLLAVWRFPVSGVKALSTWWQPRAPAEQSLVDSECFSDDDVFEDSILSQGPSSACQDRLKMNLSLNGSSLGLFDSDYSPKRSTPKPLRHRPGQRLHSTPTLLATSGKVHSRRWSSFPPPPFDLSLADSEESTGVRPLAGSA